MPGASALQKRTPRRVPDDVRYGPEAPQLHGVRMTAYGHSFGQVQPVANVISGGRYTERLRDLIHADVNLYVNRTISGSTMSGIANNAVSTWVDGNGGLVTLMGNQNDVGNHTAQTTYKNAVTLFLNTMLGLTGYPPTVLVIKDVTCTAAGYARYATPPTDADVATYNGWLMDVVGTFPTGWIVVADPLADGYNPTTMAGPDGQHPNERGMAHIVASCIKALSTAPYRQGLNVGVVGPAIPTIPTPLTLTATGGDTTVTLSSTGGLGPAVTYAVYRGTTATGSPIATSLPFTDTGRTNATAYSYVVTATNTAGTVTSNVATATANPTAPTALTIAVTGANTQATITAAGAAGATSYALYRGSVVTGSPIATAFPFTDTGLTNGTAYSYIATATNSVGTVTSSVVSVTPLSPLSVTDGFHRANFATLGTTDTGQSWAMLSTGTFGIKSNEAIKQVNGSGSEDMAVVDIGRANIDMTITLGTMGGSGIGPAFRATDVNNMWIVDCAPPSGMKLYKRTSGSYALIQTLSAAAVAQGDLIRVIANGSTISVYKNGAQVGTTVTDSYNSTATKHGFRMSGNVLTATVDNFVLNA